MTQKTRNIIGWILTGLLGLLFIGSAIMKLAASEETLKGAAAFGISEGTFKLFGIIEIISIILFIIPRTGVAGTLLLAAYMGGAIATHFQHQMPVLPNFIFEALIWITAAVRFPELTQRLTGKKQTV